MLEQALYGTRRRASVLALLTSSALGVVEASAQVNITFTLDTTGQPVWNRPLPTTGFPPFTLSGVGTAVPYLALPVQTIGSGVVTHSWTAPVNLNPDTVGYIYIPSFNAAQPLVNAIRGDDDGGPGNNSLIVEPLIAGVNYVVVSAGFNNASFGVFTLDMSSPSVTGLVVTGDLAGFTGPTTVTTGTLLVNGSLANSAVTVNAGGTLGGNGIVGNTTINAGGTLAPGSNRSAQSKSPAICNSSAPATTSWKCRRPSRTAPT